MRAHEFLEEPFQGLDLEMEFDEDEIWVTARDASGRELGHVLFVDTGDELVPQDLEVEERFRGQGIARVMNDWVKSKGYRIRRSNSQTRAGAEFWNRNRPGENVWEQGVAEGTLTEYRNALYDFVKSKFPGWPEYVLRDFLYAQAKGIRDQQELKDFLERNQKDFGQVKWRLEKLPITLDIFTAKTQRMIRQREGGRSNPNQVPRDAERHALQQRMIQQTGVSSEPIIVAKLSNGYDLIEGWHRTIQHLQAYPEGYTAPAWVGHGATYTSKSMAENFADGKVQGKSRPGRVKRAGASCNGSVTDLRKRAKNSSGERAKMYHWCANMKSGRNK